jgi:hypothetical protein
MRPGGGLSIFGLALQSGPRFARDAFGPLLTFCVYVTVNFVTGFPLAAVIMVWSMWYGARSLPSHLAARGDKVALPRPAPTGLTARNRLGKRVE